MTDAALEAFSDTSFCGFGLGPQCGVNVQPEHNYIGTLFTLAEPLAVLNGTGAIAHRGKQGGLHCCFCVLQGVSDFTQNLFIHVCLESAA